MDVPLLAKTAGWSDSALLNEHFFYIMSKMADLQGLRHHAPKSMEDVDRIIMLDFPAAAASK